MLDAQHHFQPSLSLTPISLAPQDYPASVGPQVASPCVVPGQSLRGLARLGVLVGQPVVDPCADKSLRRHHPPLFDVGEPLATALASKPLGEPFCRQAE